MDVVIGQELESCCLQKSDRCYTVWFYAAHCCPYLWNKRLPGATEIFGDLNSDLHISRNVRKMNEKIVLLFSSDICDYQIQIDEGDALNA
jgi:hypothetical protein